MTEPNTHGCQNCRLPDIACICQYTPKITAGVEFCLLTHETEYRKPTNTGRLIADCLESTKLYTWSRTEIAAGLKQELANPDVQHWLVFPAGDAGQQHRVKPFEIPSSGFGHGKEKRPVFILLDATWQQAAKMFRKSPYLNALPILSLNPKRISHYHLRRASDPHHLCTVEVAVELLNLVGDKRSAQQLDDYFHVFSQHYLAARSGHGVKTESEQMRRLKKEHHHEVN
ncbi:tRNA-uridine aminocarboxypropyltransferase [Alkalimarinus coralli]|uniref:tRNA-uridine aminocarboxypropyltransferase n=1 Tax=Alkalimarinus coralli TaxID=2935863 RepID=UPI00202B42A3|nr:DTW domain-containing protein [Alkalimarinus coralli]